MPDVPAARQCLRAMTALLLLWPSLTPSAFASEWDTMRDRQRDALKAAEGRIAEIESRARPGPTDREKLADKITRERIARARASLKSGGIRDGKVVDVDAGQLLRATQEWERNGDQRRALRESSARLQKNLELANLNQSSARDALQAMAARVPESGVVAMLAGMEIAASEAGERLSARWQREHAARERAREQREREAGQLERGVR